MSTLARLGTGLKTKFRRSSFTPAAYAKGLSAMGMNINQHLAAISPYFKMLQQPAPASGQILSAVYLFRHGIIHVNGHDYNEGIAPFLQKLKNLQQLKANFARRELKFLHNYSSWISQDDIGQISRHGLQQCRGLGKQFRSRYAQWLHSSRMRELPAATIWSDAARRCEESARAFGEGFAGSSDTENDGSQVRVETIVIDARESSGSCNNLCCHSQYAEIDQTAGQQQANNFKIVYTKPVVDRLEASTCGQYKLTSDDIYAMQLICCYDICAGKVSPFSDLFTSEDWLGFEYMRDIKYHYSEGYGMPKPGIYATPWLEAAVKILQSSTKTIESGHLPLWISFTHREEILYLAVLLGLGGNSNEAPRTDHIDRERSWQVSSLAPYLGHIGLETYRGTDVRNNFRIIVNGEVTPGFQNELLQDPDGGYDEEDVISWMSVKVREWDNFKGGRLTFLD